MDGKKARKTACTPQKTEDEEKTTDGANHKAHGLMHSMRKLMKNKKKKSDKSGSSSGSTTTTGSSSSRHHLVSEFTRARPHKESAAAPKPGEKVDDKELRGAPALVATPGVPVGPTPPTPTKQPIPQATMMVFTVFENDPAVKGGGGGGEKLAVCRPDKDAKLQWQSAEAERAASRERSREDQTDEDHARTTTPEERTPVKKKSKQRTKTLDSQHPTNREKAKTPMKGGRTPVTAKGRTPARTPVSPF